MIQGVRNLLNLQIQTELLNGEALLSDIDKINSDPNLRNMNDPPRPVLRNRSNDPRISNPIQDNKLTIGSMNAAALFPSVKQHMAMEATIKPAIELDFKPDIAKLCSTQMELGHFC